MTDLIAVPQPNPFHKLKALVLDRVSSPITKRVYNLGLDEFFAWYGLEPRAGFTKATGERLAGCTRSPRARRRFDQRPDYRRPQTGRRSGRQRAASARTGQRNYARERRRLQGCAPGNRRRKTQSETEGVA